MRPKASAITFSRAACHDGPVAGTGRPSPISQDTPYLDSQDTDRGRVASRTWPLLQQGWAIEEDQGAPEACSQGTD